MPHPVRKLLLPTLTALACCTAFAAQPIIYPAKGQSLEQQKRDEAECDAWAVQATGIDPRVLASQPLNVKSPPPPDTSAAGGERARGAVRGAVGGAAIGAIAGDTGKGAGVGAVVGVMRGGQQSRQRQAQEQQAYAQQQARAQQQAQNQRQEQMNTYYRGYGACLEGRGYTIK